MDYSLSRHSWSVRIFCSKVWSILLNAVFVGASTVKLPSSLRAAPNVDAPIAADINNSNNRSLYALTPSPLSFWNGLFHLRIWTHPFMQVGIRGKISDKLANRVDHDEMAHEQSHLDLHCLQRYLYWSVGMRKLKCDILSTLWHHENMPI